jgi:hypothetical protein
MKTMEGHGNLDWMDRMGSLWTVWTHGTQRTAWDVWGADRRRIGPDRAAQKAASGRIVPDRAALFRLFGKTIFWSLRTAPATQNPELRGTGTIWEREGCVARLACSLACASGDVALLRPGTDAARCKGALCMGVCTRVPLRKTKICAGHGAPFGPGRGNSTQQPATSRNVPGYFYFFAFRGVCTRVLADGCLRTAYSGGEGNPGVVQVKA